MTVIRIAVVTKSGVLAGGANTYETAVLRLLRQLSETSPIVVDVVSPREVPGAEGEVGVSSHHPYSNTIFAKIRSVLASTLVGRALSRVLPISPLTRPLRALQPDFIYFPSPNIHALGLYRYPFLFTVWDLGHRELRQFPEFRNPIEYWLRERLFRHVLLRAARVITDSRWTGRALEKAYGLSAKEWVSLGMAFTVGEDLPDRVEVPEQPYFLYPAQKWPHKNHEVLLRAFAMVTKRRPDIRLVLIGSAKEYGVDIGGLVDELGLAGQVDDRGFVPRSTALALMSGATALVMPTFLGPTNLPPLEAARLGVPSLISDVHHFDEDVSTFVSLIAPDDIDSWADHLLRALDSPRPESASFPEIASGTLRQLFEEIESTAL